MGLLQIQTGTCGHLQSLIVVWVAFIILVQISILRMLVQDLRVWELIFLIQPMYLIVKSAKFSYMTEALVQMSVTKLRTTSQTNTA